MVVGVVLCHTTPYWRVVFTVVLMKSLTSERVTGPVARASESPSFVVGAVMCAAIAAAAVISAAAVASSTAGLRCPGGTVHLDGPFDFNQTSWVACEDLTVPGGAMALVSARGDTEWFEKGFAPYGTAATDEDCKIPRPGLRPQSVAMFRRGVVLLASGH